MKIRQSIAVAAVAAGMMAASGQANATAPERFTESEHLQEVWGTCGPDDELVADYTLTETVTEFSPNVGTLHLQLVGTVTRTGTGVVGNYAERQRDFVDLDGSEKVVGLLGHLVVPGHRGLTFGGQIRVGADGTVFATPDVAPLLTFDDEDIVSAFCDALAG
jgi:hypothetical protein